jgi:hypothetical protein
MLAMALVDGCASSAAKKAEAERATAAQRNFDSVAQQQLKLTPAQESKLATVYKWQAQQSAPNQHLAVGDERLFLDDAGGITPRRATVDDVDKYVLGRGMPTDLRGINSVVDVHVRSILNSQQYAVYHDELTPEQRTALAEGLRTGMRSSSDQK